MLWFLSFSGYFQLLICYHKTFLNQLVINCPLFIINRWCLQNVQELSFIFVMENDFKSLLALNKYKKMIKSKQHPTSNILFKKGLFFMNMSIFNWRKVLLRHHDLLLFKISLRGIKTFFLLFFFYKLGVHNKIKTEKTYIQQYLNNNILYYWG